MSLIAGEQRRYANPRLCRSSSYEGFQRKYNLANGIQSFQISWISKASAAQRTGRAGRTGPGHCYRLYSSAVFENYFNQFSQPEILRVPIEGVVLQMKCMHIDTVANFPFPTPPDRQSLRQAEKILMYLGALQALPNKTDVAGNTVSDLGRTMSLFPLSPRFSKILTSSRRHGCLPYAIAIVAAISVGDPFLREDALDVEHSSRGEEDMVHLSKEEVREKEMLKHRRREYFQSQQVYSFQTAVLRQTQKFLPSIMHHSANPRAICSGSSLWLVLMNTQVEVSHFVSSIS
jgi:ATP-dependent RNA helicase DHX37/DHR1